MEPGTDRGADAADDIAALRARLAARPTVAERYTAQHGHPLGHDGLTEGRTARWALAPRMLVLAVVTIVLVTAVLVWRVQAGGPGEVVPLDALPAGTAGGPEPEAEPDGGSDPAGPGTVEPESVIAHVVGQVERPGVVELPAGARVYEAVEAAGGVTADADLSAVNLARVLGDGEQVVIPAVGEAPPGGPESGQGSGDAGTALIDVNAADAGQLETLPGIGPVLAQRIVDHRTTHGPFTSVAQLQDVSGIGPALLAQIEDLVRT